ncbi:unnamed protein product [Parnassius apollo]|uniref:(apollo) hypothetical protein n=1 Tax=Parnassius apollo TaxID=110799 RepID=A0A8S3YC81_PARAO|nr:unnamed protein product [Parnassius apollo]
MILAESSSDEGEFVASDNEHDYIPLVEEGRFEISDVEPEVEVENEIDSYDSDASFEGESLENILITKDGMRWQFEPLRRTQNSSRNIIRQRGGAASFSKLYNQMEIFKNILSNEMCDIILRETDRKGTKITEAYNNKLMENNPDISKRPKQKIFKPFAEQELDAFFGILIFSGVHRSYKEHLTELWESSLLPLFQAAMSHDRFKMLLRFLRFNINSSLLELSHQHPRSVEVNDAGPSSLHIQGSDTVRATSTAPSPAPFEMGSPAPSLVVPVVESPTPAASEYLEVPTPAMYVECSGSRISDCRKELPRKCDIYAKGPSS